MTTAESKSELSTEFGDGVFISTLRGRTYSARLIKQITRNRLNITSLFILLVFVIMAIIPNYIIIQDPGLTDVSEAFQSPNGQAPLGTDRLGRDIFSRVVSATRVSLALPFLSVFLGVLMGGLLGMISGFSGEFISNIISRLMDVIFGLPVFLFAIIVVAFLGSSLRNTVLAIGIIFTPIFYRFTWTSALAEQNKEYVHAAVAIGSSQIRIMFHQILPNVVSPVSVIAVTQLASAVIIEASMSFLGLGTSVTNPSWGRMLFDNYPTVELSPWGALFPGLAIVLVVIALNLMGDAFRDALDPSLD